jgi:CRISPR-associated protein Csm3
MTTSSPDRVQVPFIGKLIIKSTLIVETGLHIGGGGETLDIGGLDHPVIRNPLNRHPYIPGSSVKGKLRSLLERYKNLSLNRKSQDLYRHECNHTQPWLLQESQQNEQLGAKDCPVCRIFGSTGMDCFILKDQKSVKTKGENKPARLIVRDSQLSDESIKLLEQVDTGLYMTEWKFENGIDRVTAAANPRQIERVPAGSKFNFELVYTVEELSQVEEDLKSLVVTLAILEDDALGGHGSRGYGKIKFENFNFYCRNIDQYRQIVDTQPNMETPIPTIETISDLLKSFGTLSHEIQQRFSFAEPPTP